MTVVRRAVHIVGLIQLAARKLRRHRMIMAHRLNEARVLQRIRRGAPVLREEDRGQNSQHECNATEIQPDPLPWISLWMKYRMDLKGHVEIMHQPRPDGDGCHIRKHAFQINSQQAKEGREEMAEDNDHANEEPRPLLAQNVKSPFIREIAVPDNEVLREIDVSVEHSKCEQQ